MTPSEAAKFLRNLCELTACNTQNWDNMQAVFEQFITDAYKGGITNAANKVEGLDNSMMTQVKAAAAIRALVPEKKKT